jgi:hypothetical protein
VGLTNLGSESETCVGSRVHLVGVSISFEKNFYRLSFTPPSLVRRIGPSENPGKLHESWEGPFIAKETDMPGAFCLREQTGEELPYSWNADSLKRYYP